MKKNKINKRKRILHGTVQIQTSQVPVIHFPSLPSKNCDFPVFFYYGKVNLVFVKSIFFCFYEKNPEKKKQMKPLVSFLKVIYSILRKGFT